MTTAPFLSGFRSRQAYRYDIHDFGAIRKAMMANVEDAVRQRFPLENERYSLSVDDVGYDGGEDFSIKEQKKALLEGRTLGRRLRGKWILADKASGKVVARTGRRTLATVPYLTERGTFIRNGNEMVVSNIMRLVPGVYVRTRANGSSEAHVNVEQGTGQTFKIEMNPENGVFSLHQGSGSAKLYPLLQAMGVPDGAIEGAWGKELLEVNKRATNAPISAAIAGLEKKAADEPRAQDVVAELVESFRKRRLDPEATRRTLGKAYDHVDSDVLLDTSAKLLRLSRGEEDDDNRDSLEFQRVYGPAELFAERIAKDGGQVARRLLWKATTRSTLDWLPSGALNPHVDSIFSESGLARYVEGSSPVDAVDSATALSRIGEGGISSERSASDAMRLVQDSFRGFVDPIRGPESSRIGLDTYLAQRTMKGSDGLLYTQLVNAKTGKPEWVDSRKAAVSNIATNEFLGGKDRFVPVAGGPVGIRIIPRSQVDYYNQDTDGMFSLGSNLVPLRDGVKGMRLLMGGKYFSQALPLVGREAPLVRSLSPATGRTAEHDAGRLAGARVARKDGVVRQVRRDKIIVEYADGERDAIELYDNFPANQKGYLRNIPEVKTGDSVKKGQVLASSNYTDAAGNLAAGTNLRVAYLSYKGHNFEDAVVISDAAAKKLTSETMIDTSLQREKNIDTSKVRFLARHPGKFTREQLDKLDDSGLVKPGQVVHHGDPMILGIRENEPSPGTAGRRTFVDVSQVWEHDYPGIVTDIAAGRGSYRVLTRANVPMQVGDKLSNRFGSKGVVSLILPDNQMPLDAKGKPFEVLMSPLSVVSRTNPAQLVEAAYGKIAAKTGKPVELPSFAGGSMVDKAIEDLRANRLSDVDDLVDPETGRTIPKVFNGVAYFQKLKHTAESKEGGRGVGGYSMEDAPSSGGYEGSKRLGSLETSGLVGHGAMEFLKDAKLVRGQVNDDFWRDFRMGKTPVMPGTPLVHRKLIEHLRGSGINVREGRDRIDIFGMTDQDVKKMTGGREVRSTDTFDTNSYRPIDGGLFGADVFGKDGDHWGYITLDEPVPNPVMKDSLRRILNLSAKDFNAIAEGRQQLGGLTGGGALRKALESVDLDRDIKYSMAEIGRASGSRRDAAIKRYRALASIKMQGLHPSDFILDRVPVLPPRFRPIVSVEGTPVVADSNYLYKALLEARDDLRSAKKELPPEMLADARAQVYRNFEAITGLSDPDDVKLQQKGVEGLLRWVFGKGSPKFGAFQRRVIGTAVDTVGRGTATPNPALRLNQIGLPEEQAWTIYEPFVVKGLVAQGYKATDAVKMTANRHPAAYGILRKTVEERPVVMTRAPVLHKFGLMGFWPVLSKGNTIQVSPSIVTPFNLDFDGDAVNLHVPVTRKAVEEVRNRMMPERNLLDVRNFAAHYKPMREYLQGLYLATRRAPGDPVSTFASAEEAAKAYREGKIDIDTPIRIVEK